jgi:hypothetical protein
MSARGPQDNTYGTITSDFKSKMSCALIQTSETKKMCNTILDSTPLALRVNGGMKPNYGRNKARSLVVMNALPTIEGATEYDIINNYYDRQFNVAICGATGNVGR